MQEITTKTKGYKIYVAGAALEGEGYPNAENTLRLLNAELGVEVIDCAVWLPKHFQLWKLYKEGTLKGFLSAGRLAYSNIVSLFKVRRGISRGSILYVPYPGLIFLSILSVIPKKYRPLVISDSYICMWDALIQDRNAAGKDGYLSRVLFNIEKRSLRVADVLLVDTVASSQFVKTLFNTIHTPIAIPLALPLFNSRASDEKDLLMTGKINVVFLGTLIPLHGVEVILDATKRLISREDIHFTIIGDGQMAFLLDEMRGGISANITRISEWVDVDQLISYIDQADICLGVFGGNEKSRRVFPFKLYWYFSRGKAVITQEVYSLPEKCPEPPVKAVKPMCGKSLAEAIRWLADNPKVRGELERDSKRYYDQHLSDVAIASRWSEVLVRVHGLT